MKILHTDIFRLSIKMEPFNIATGTMDYAQNVFIRIHTDSGIYGVGECSAFPVITGETQETCLAVAKDFAKLWKSKDPSAIEERLAELDLFIAGNRTIKSAFDMALYDIAAKANGQPLYQYLGGTKKTIETDITIGIGDIDSMAEKALAFKKSGATCIKVKLGKEVEQDVARMQKIRAVVGDATKLRIDANQGWSFEEAQYALTAMKDLQIQFCEQPMRAWNDDYLPELRKVSSVKIMADESCYTHHDARRLIRAGACDYINIKLVKSGGICEAIKIQELAKQAGIACMLGGMLESRLALSAKLHFAYAADNVIFHDMDTCLIGHLEDPVINGAKYNGYFLDIDDLPGIGADIDEDFLKSCDHWTI
ncbi:mandelate racemase/muconate lactonizing enzyme family protein [Sphingobacterium chuzhouense]|uniref:Dipeptide epimerase n=1 Tax=Sphingobacterium chuzhouense TaxID=1742264 RepID=A0ABR7XLE4_9SPHI|nr:dipeptide epimerase [Sphingobacterium chuzhouense]MBD1419986.1 dipeptide epimerase [Sphingobacterium chuzhouense]